jgi:homoserine dehydrogenase
MITAPARRMGSFLERLRVILLVAFLLLPQVDAFQPVRCRPSISRLPDASRLLKSELSAVRTLGIFGGGTVGGGIVEILTDASKQEYLRQVTGGVDWRIKTICVRDANKKRDFGLPPNCVVTTNYDDILKDDEIDLVVEVMGGTTDAKDIVYRAIKSGKDVVTANKALIAKHLPEMESLLMSSTSQFRYEAAVCGGIPIIRSMQSDYVGDSITMMCGIINGCTNFMLTAMDQNSQSYEQALAQASALGYAEADPTLDVGGFDARSKLKILMRLAYGIDVEEEEIACRGITELSKLDFEYAKMMGGTIKLIGVAKSVGPNKIAAFVSPCYLTNKDSLSSVNGATNAVEIISKNLQSTTYIGPGAGRYPTANSCINDILALCRGDKNNQPFTPANEQRKFVNNYDSVFYIRIRYRDEIGITRACGEICERYNVSIHSILQNPVTSRDDAAFVLVTEKVSVQSVKNVCTDIEGLDWCRGPTFHMPVLREDWITGMSSFS